MRAPQVELSGNGTDRGNAASGRGVARRALRRTDTMSLADIGRAVVPAPIRRLLSVILAWASIAAGLAGAVALATWTVSDPSLTFANGQNAENWLGFWGASFADLSMQFIGLAGIALVAMPIIWGVLALTARPLQPLGLRIFFGLAALLSLAAALGCLGLPANWPLRSSVGLGGVIGDAVLSIPRAFTGAYPEGWLAAILFAVFGSGGLYLFGRATNLHRGIPKPERERAAEPAVTDADEGEEGRDWGALVSAPLGLILHLGYSVSAAFRRRRPRMAVEHARAEPSLNHAPEHVEPVFDDAMAFKDTVDFDDPYTDAPAVSSGLVIEPRVAAPPVPDAMPEPVSAKVAPAAPATQAAAAPVAAPVVKRAPAKPVAETFELPALDLLAEQKNLVDDPSLSNEVLAENAAALESVLEDFGVKGSIIKVRPGPVVTLYELEPAPGVKSSRVIGLAEDIARSMSAIAARVAVVPGRNAIGIELPNKRRETVYLREQLASKEFTASKAKLPMCLGKTIGGEPVIADMAKMPHLLVAGTTGSGKSVAINTMILSLLYRLGPDRCRLIMIDPKMLELSIYDGIPHLLTPVVVDPKKAVVALKWTVREMEERYKKMSKLGVRNIDGFNTRVKEAAEKGEVITRTVQTGFDRESGEAIYEHEELELEALPYIVVIIDEMADLMMVAGKDIEGTVQRLAQMARAAGIHVIMATQRPSTDVITGTIKANFPTRISFQVTSKIDSRVMLGESGAEQLLGMGDMLYMAGGGRITRVHGPFVDDHEVEDIVNHLKLQGVPQYLEGITDEDEEDGEGGASAGDSGGGGAVGNIDSGDALYDQAVAIVLKDRKASTSYIQRRLSVGYNKAASLIERMEQEGLISPANHSGKREILIPAEDEGF